MKKTLSFNVEIEFESELTDEKDVLKVAENIAEAVKEQTNSYSGVAPEWCDTYAVSVRVTPQYLNTPVVLDLIK